MAVDIPRQLHRRGKPKSTDQRIAKCESALEPFQASAHGRARRFHVFGPCALICIRAGSAAIDEFLIRLLGGQASVTEMHLWWFSDR